MTKFWHSTFSKIPKNKKITDNDKTASTHQKHYFLHMVGTAGNHAVVGISGVSSVLQAQTEANFTLIALSWHSTCSKIQKNSHNYPQWQNRIKTPKALRFKLGGNGWESCCASNARCWSCSIKTIWIEFVIFPKTNYSIVAQHVLKIPENDKITINDKKASKHQKNYFSNRVGMTDNHGMLAIAGVTACLAVEGLNEMNW